MKFWERMIDEGPMDPSFHARRSRVQKDDDDHTVRLVAAGHEFSMHVPGTDAYDVAEKFRRWIDDGDDPTGDLGDVHEDWRVVDVIFQGVEQIIVFRASWVAGWTIQHKVE